MILTATDGHPIWDATTNKLTNASDLKIGDKLSTGVGTTSVVSLSSYQADLTAYNLQISNIHTYYAETTPVLVHNSCTTAADVLQDPEAVEGLTPSQVDDLANNAGYETSPGRLSASNPATRYYVPGTNESVGFRVLPEGVAGQGGNKAGGYLSYFGGAINGIRKPWHPNG